MTPRRSASVGQSVPGVRDTELSTGAAAYLRDRHPEGLLWLAFARSEGAHAVLEGVELEAVRAVGGVHTVLSGGDLDANSDMVPPLSRDGRPMRVTRRPLLARDRVRFFGEPVAAVLAERQYAAWDGAAATRPALSPLPVVLDPFAAASDDAPRLFDPESNVLLEEGEGWDEAGAALADCAHVVARRFTVGRYAPSPLEARAIVVEPAGDGVRVWSSTQAPAQLKRAILGSIDLSEDAVEVIASRVGGGFGQKAHAYPEEVLAVLCCLRTGRPVKWLESRSENLQAACHARDQVVDCEAGCDAEGRLRVLRCDVVSDVGAYGVWPHGHLLEALGTPVAMPGAYELSAFGYRTRAIATNKCPGGAYRGVGFAVSTFVRERILDVLASSIGADRLELRERSSADGDAGWVTATGLELRGDFPRVLREAADALAADDGDPPPEPAEPGSRVGTGYALYVEPVSPGALVFSSRGMAGIVGYDEARVCLEDDGRIAVVTSSPAIGQGTETTFAQVVADALRCPLDLVRVEASTTAGGLDGTGTFASRSAASVAVACEQAASVLCERLIAAGAPEVGLPELAQRLAPAEREVTRRTDPEWGDVAYGAHACTVRADPRTGAVEVLRYAVVEDCGETINPGIVRNQTLGGVAQGTGMALTERLNYDPDGRPQVSGLADYRVPRAAEAPDCRMRHLKSEASAGRRLGVGEGGAVAAAAALANAVSDAVGVEVNSMPFDPEEVWRLCRSEAEQETTRQGESGQDATFHGDHHSVVGWAGPDGRVRLRRRGRYG